MDNIKEVIINKVGIFKSIHENYKLAFEYKGKIKGYRFEKGILRVTDPEDIEAIYAEYDKRYLRKTPDGSPMLNEHGQKVYEGDMRFFPIDEYEKSRLLTPAKIKSQSGKIYEITEQDLIDIVNKKEREQLKTFQPATEPETVPATVPVTATEKVTDPKTVTDPKAPLKTVSKPKITAKALKH